LKNIHLLNVKLPAVLVGVLAENELYDVLISNTQFVNDHECPVVQTTEVPPAPDSKYRFENFKWFLLLRVISELVNVGAALPAAVNPDSLTTPAVTPANCDAVGSPIINVATVGVSVDVVMFSV
jgi:hypothetical protein